LSDWGRNGGHKLVLIDKDFPGILNETLLQRSVIAPSADDLPCLEDGEFLNDSVIEFYLSLLKTLADRKGITGLAIMSTQTLPTIQRDACSPDSLRNMVFRWFVKNGNIKPDADRVIIPCNEAEVHWLVAEAIVPERKVKFYCSDGGRDFKRFQRLIEVFFRELSNFRKYRRFGGAWTFEIVRGIPLQTDGFSCGLYVCAFADCLVVGTKPARISSGQIMSLRKALRELVKALR
jgi:Ulp1 family protease